LPLGILGKIHITLFTTIVSSFTMGVDFEAYDAFTAYD
jgi:hypothetical protein